MEVLLTERLVCPRCGPPFGLVLLAQRVEERRVLDGSLGCPNCRDRFPVVEGFGDLRPPPRDELPPAPAPAEAPDSAEVIRVAALLGIATGPARVALLGPVGASAAGLAALIPELEVIVVSAGRLPGPEASGVSRMATGSRLPFQSRALQGVVLSGGADVHLLQEAARAVAPGARMVVLGSPIGIREQLAGAGLQVLFEQDEVLVLATGGPKLAAGGLRLPVVRGR